MPPTTRKTRNTAKRLRSDMTGAEWRLWQAVRAHRLDGLSIRRQVPIGPYIVDFYCPEAQLVIELDGAVHGMDRQISRDRSRENWLKDNGYHVVRFWNDEVTHTIDQVCYAILWHAGLIKPEGPLSSSQVE